MHQLSNDRVLTVSRQNRVQKRTFPRSAKLLARARFTTRNKTRSNLGRMSIRFPTMKITRSMNNTMTSKTPKSIMDPTKVEARSDTREIPLATIDERHPSNTAGSQDTSSENAKVITERCPIPPQANTLTLERTFTTIVSCLY